ncbi:SusC/RagA family TonB-linked outer membrane protein [Prevotella sp. 10(H)]|uniref:SusC/RagA family TonB-linked outer membrane protein n=1 Tax=Prevotella sp. 10(H) TaxID=1158294 RepID=UPI0004A76313|nr:SusC/RagA family TonB-linked outer membrane protein [Prevotella sp. 10(H)]
MKKLLIIIVYLLLGVGTILAQTRTVQGTVVDENGEPFIGVTVSVKGSSTGTITDPDGKFSLRLSQSVKKLTFSFVGYETQEIDVTADMKVTMTPSTSQLSEVVITGMTTMDRRTFTGSADRLQAENITLSGVSDISRSLEGRSAGVSVQNVSGTFGAAPRIRVRGATSIYGNSKPLWVVDGVILDDVIDVGADDLSSGDAVTLISSAVAGLNSDDIESFDILKDGSATSIYGARAMAGVIVITTKKGRAGRSSVNYTGEFTTRMKPSYNEFNIMNSQEQMGFYRELEQKGWLNFSGTLRASNSGVYGKMYQLMNTYDPLTGYMMDNTEAAANAYLREAEMRNTNWFGELFSPSIMQNHSVSVSSGTEKTSVYGSLSAMFDPGWYKRSEVKRYTANVNINHKILENLSVNLISSASYRNQEAPGTVNQEVDGVSGVVRRTYDINPYSYALNTSRTLDPNTFYTRNYAPFNIMHELRNNYMDLDVTNVKFQMELKWRPLPELELSLLGAYKYSQSATHHHIKDNSNQAMAFRAMGDATIREANPNLYKDPDFPNNLPISVLPEGGIYQRRDYSQRGYDIRPALSWNKTFNNVHDVSAYGGLEVRASDNNNTYFNGWGLQYELGETPFYVYQYFKRGLEQGSQYYSVSNTHRRDVAYFGQATYGYDSRYSVSGTFRYEGSNRLGMSRKSRWLPTWNVGASWTPSNESFMNNLRSTISHLKLRTSYSMVAQAPPSNVTNSLPVIGSVNPWRYFTNAQESGLNMTSQENRDLTYEKKHELSVAVEAGFINNRFNAIVEYFNRKNYDLIGPLNTQGMGGTTQKRANVAEMKGHGFEVTLGSDNIRTKDFTWHSDFIFGYAKTEVTKLQAATRIIDLITKSGFTKEGYPHRGLFSIPFVGLNQYGYPVIINQNGDETSTTMGFQESRPEYTNFLIYEGPTEPEYTGSLQNTFKYKNFKLNIFMTYAFGNVVRLDNAFASSYNDLVATPREFKNRWVLPGDENSTHVPVILSRREYDKNTQLATGYNSYNYTSVRSAKGDFIRMKEMSLTYDFPKAWLGNSISNLSLKLQATNLFLIYADKKLNGQDPEFFNAGGVAAPMPRQFTLTVRLGI